MIYAKTALGLTALQDRSMGLTPRQRSAFILFDGKRDSIEVLKMTEGIGIRQSDVDHLVAIGLLALSNSASQAAEAVPEFPKPIAPAVATVASKKLNGMPTLNDQAHYMMAYPIATRLTAGLGLRGFRLNLAVEAATDLAKLKELAPRIREAVGAEKYQQLDDALNF